MPLAVASDPAEASAFHETLLSAGQYELAEQLLRACVERGHNLSRVPLGRVLVGRGALAEAVEVVQPAADAGLPEGGVLLGLAEEKRGRLDEARFAHRRAAAAGDGRAAHKLGMLSLASGDDTAARQWFLEGARAGEASSMFNLADMEDSPLSARSGSAEDAQRTAAAFREAVDAASGDVAPTVATSRDWARWCAEQDDWDQSAAAAGIATTAVERLDRAQTGRADRELALARASGLAEQAAVALVRAGRPQDALVALERDGCVSSPTPCPGRTGRSTAHRRSPSWLGSCHWRSWLWTAPVRLSSRWTTTARSARVSCRT